jgi:hypothetical protein
MTSSTLHMSNVVLMVDSCAPPSSRTKENTARFRMKSLLFLLQLVATLTYSQKSEYIILAHIGEQVHSINPITVLLQGSTATKVEEHQRGKFNFPQVLRDKPVQFDTATFVLYGKTIMGWSDSLLHQKKREWLNIGAYQISYYKNDRCVKTYTIFHGKDTEPFFLKLISLNPVTKNEESVKRLRFLLCDRIGEFENRDLNCEKYLAK